MEIITDNFAGGGGASEGIRLALSRDPDIAVNHDTEALAMHAANHPGTRHLCEDVFSVDIPAVCAGRPVGLAWFSPDCKHFSKAKGGKPRNKKIRALAWVMVKWARIARPRVMVLENVEEFKTWGPLLADGSPCARRKGSTFKSFISRLRRIGYAVEWRELRACDYGAPTIRKRLFLIARCDGHPIVWPEPTHGAPTSGPVVAGQLLPWRTAAECIDFTLPCPSIFDRKKPLAEATLRRIARGLRKFVIEAAEPFVINVANSKTTGRGPNAWSADEPLRTVTAAPGFAVVTPILTEHANASSPRCNSVADPLRTQCAQVKGGHFALVAAFLSEYYGEGSGGLTRATSPGDPVKTVVAENRHALVTAHIAKLRGTNTGHAMDEPAHTISAQGNHLAEVRAFLIKYYGNEKDGCELLDPMHTVTSKDRLGLVTIRGTNYVIADIGLRMLSPRELFRAQGFPEAYIIGDRAGDALKLTKSAQVRMCGNSVCPPLACAIVRANVPELARRQVAA